MRSGSRLKILRYLLGLKVKDMMAILELDNQSRYENVERGQVKMNEDDFRAIYKNMVLVIPFIIAGEPLSRTALDQNDTILKTIPSRVDAGLVPDFFDPSMLTD